MWQKHSLKLPTTNTRGGNASFLLSGTKIAVHNWTHGKKEASGQFLSPENAVNAIAAKFSDYSDVHRPKGEVDAVLLLITSPHESEFIEQLDALSGVLDYSEVKQAAAYAKANQGLSVSKMVKPPTIQYPAFNANADLTPSIGRQMQAVQNAQNLASLSGGDIFATLNQLKALKAEKAQQLAEKTAKLTAIKAEAFVCIEHGFLDVIAQNLQEGLPTSENIYSFLIAFVGENLQALRNMVEEKQ